jgi:hypothetical protein
MIRYEGFEALAQLTALTLVKEGCYNKFIQTGQLCFHDYGRGFIDLAIHVVHNHKKEYSLRISFGTIDDGDFGAWIPQPSFEAAVALSDRVANEVFANMIAFPTKEHLNVILRPYGIYVDYE